MHLRRAWILLLAAVACSAALAQEPPPAAGQPQGPPPAGRRWGRGMGMGSAVAGTVTEVASDHFTVKNFAGETWTVHYSANTRFVKQPPRSADDPGAGPSGEAPEAGPGGQGRGIGMGGYPPTPIKAGDIKVGDSIMAGGEIDQQAKSVGAVGVMLVDPERAKQMREMQANYGKTWLMGRVTAIDETKVTVEGGIDRTPHTFVADENTAFRRRREPITLADVQVGDTVRVEGSIKDGQFVATQVAVMMPSARGGPVPRQGPPPQ